MEITVEFFGIPRQRAGRAKMKLSLRDCAESATLGTILEILARELPDFARDCVVDNRLKKGYIANINGQRFITDPEAPITDGETLLILSADAGG
jgi:molybdopterin converting factor small subunit